MRIIAVAEHGADEGRVAITPESVGVLRRLVTSKPAEGSPAPEVTVAVETGIGVGCGFSDASYVEAGAEVISDRSALVSSADVVLGVSDPRPEAIGHYRRGAVHAGFLDVFRAHDTVRSLASQGVSAFSMELMPRTTRAQAMDALSSQHSLAGYYMVVLAAERLGRVLPMMVTPSGTLKAARVLVIGAGVAGLQAIATAKRLGARVEAFDTRPATKEQVESLGARFVSIDLGETGQTSGGYAQELSEEQKARQRAGLAKAVAESDVVITTAALFGKPAPIVVTGDMVRGMRAGAVIVDYAASSGGNVEGTRAGEEVVTPGGVRILGLRNYASRVAADASRMYASNLAALLKLLIDPKSGEQRVASLLAEGDEIVKGSLVTHDGEVVNAAVRGVMGLPALG